MNEVKGIKPNGDLDIHKGTIKIHVSQGLVSDVKGLPEGYDYKVIECDKYGNPLCPECDITLDRVKDKKDLFRCPECGYKDVIEGVD